VEALTARLGRLFFTLALLGAAMVPHAFAQRVEATEATVKAAFLYKFAGYVDWPASAFSAPDAPFVFGVVGNDEVAAELAKVTAGRQVGGHPVVVKRVREGETLRGMHTVFVGRGASDRLATLIRAAQRPALLVVTETERGLETGSAINFVVAEDRVGFEVSLDAAERNGLKISSRMLAVARRVLPSRGL
jgi:hypothetical protein